MNLYICGLAKEILDNMVAKNINVPAVTAIFMSAKWY